VTAVTLVTLAPEHPLLYKDRCYDSSVTLLVFEVTLVTMTFHFIMSPSPTSPSVTVEMTAILNFKTFARDGFDPNVTNVTAVTPKNAFSEFFLKKSFF
jgi:hypothetical protein